MGRLIDPYRLVAPEAGPSYTPLGDIVASTVFDVDATIADSYTSGQTWANIEPTPADGAAQTDYNFFLGATNSATTDDPTFTGSAGDPGAYFALDGGDFFAKTTINTSFINSLHKTTGGSDFWIAIAFRIADGASSLGLLNTQNGTASVGIRLEQQSGEALSFLQRGDSANSNVLTGALTIGTDYLVIFSHSHSGNETRRWINSRTLTAASHTFNTTTNNASGLLRLSSRTATSSPAPNGTRIYAYSMGNEYLDNTKAGLIFDEYNARHGRTYA